MVSGTASNSSPLRCVAKALNAREQRVMHLALAEFGGSALTDTAINVPVDGVGSGIPVTYVPARNTIMLSLALAWAEVLGSRDNLRRRQCRRLFRLSGLPARIHRRF